MPFPKYLQGQHRPDEFYRAKYTCPCGRPHQVTVPPDSKQIMKHECRFCGDVNELKIRDDSMDYIDQLVAEGKDKNRTIGPITHKKSVNVRKEVSLVQKAIGQRKVSTKLGDAYLIN